MLVSASQQACVVLEADPQCPCFVGDQLLKARSAAHPGAQ
jgi:hypothetical protein